MYVFSFRIKVRLNLMVDNHLPSKNEQFWWSILSSDPPDIIYDHISPQNPVKTHILPGVNRVNPIHSRWMPWIMAIPSAGPRFRSQYAVAQVRRALASWAFYTTKLRIEPILQWVYVNEQQAKTAAGVRQVFRVPTGDEQWWSPTIYTCIYIYNLYNNIYIYNLRNIFSTKHFGVQSWKPGYWLIARGFSRISAQFALVTMGYGRVPNCFHPCTGSISWQTLWSTLKSRPCMGSFRIMLLFANIGIFALTHPQKVQDI